jgi:predicted transcriptional regulator
LQNQTSFMIHGMVFRIKYRNRTEIIASILEVAKDGSNKTRIMFTAYLSYEQLKEYLNELLDKELLVYDICTRTRTYSITQRGSKFLEW